MRKTIFLIAIILFSTIMITACSNDSTTLYKSSEFRTNNSVSIKYERLNGILDEPEDEPITVYDDETCTFKFDITTESGKLDISIEDENGKVVYNKVEVPTSNFKFIVDKAGEYIVYFEAENHKGGFKLVWEYK